MKKMDSVPADKGMGVTDGSWREKRKRGRPRKYGLDAPIIHSVSPFPIAESPPPGFPSELHVVPVKNRTKHATGSVLAGGSQSKALSSENLVSAGGSQTSQTSGAKHKLAGQCPEPEYKTNIETEEITISQAQMQVHQFTTNFAELSTGFETAKKKLKELHKQVPDLVSQIQKWNKQKASRDEKKKELERERDEAQEEALKAVGEKCDLEKKLEKATKEAADAKASAKRALDERRDLKAKLEKAIKKAESVGATTKKAINEAELKFVDEKRDLEEKLKKAVKQVEDAQASCKKATYEAITSTANFYKLCLDNYVAALGNGDHVAGHEGDGDE